MPPKRKVTAAKATESIENGSESTEPKKPKRGKVAKQTEKVEKPDTDDAHDDAKKTRSGRGKAVSEKITTEAETKKEKKGKAKAEKPVEVVDSDEDLAEEAPAKQVTPKKKEAKSQKDVKPTKEKVAASKPKTNAKASPKVQRARRAKKGDGYAEYDSEPELPKKKATTTNKAKKPAATETSTKTKKPHSKATTEAKGDTLQNQTETDYSTIDFDCHLENPTGALSNFKISSWNVGGIRAWMKKNGMEYIEREHPNILCLQEIKCAKDKLPDELKTVLDYKSYWCLGDKDGYAGVALFSIEEPMNVKYGINSEVFDVEGRCITAEYNDFYVINVYVPNAGRGLVTLDKRLEWNTVFAEYVGTLDEQKPVIICGDMNVAHEEIDIANPSANKKNAGFTPQEREGMTEFLSNKYVDTYRALHPEQANAYTFWSYMSKARLKDIGWRLDYFITSKRLMNHVCDCVIRSKVFGSDHCPLVLYINV